MDFFEKFERAKKVLAQKREAKRAEKLSREQRVRVSDLFARYHSVGKVTLEFPSLFALQWLEKHFGSQESIDLSQLEHLGAVIWILENQNAVDEVMAMNAEQTAAAIRRQMAEIPARLHLDYLVCCQDILTVLKKNYISRQREILEQALTLLDTDSFPPGA